MIPSEPSQGGWRACNHVCFVHFQYPQDDIMQLDIFHSIILFPILTISMSLLRITDDNGVFTDPTSAI